MEQVLFQLQNKSSWKQSMRKTCRINRLNVQIVAAYTPLRFRASYARFKAIYQRRSADKGQRWLQNQLKAFYWFLVALSCKTQIKIQDFGQKEWKLVFEVFSFKLPLTLEYEGKKLMEESTNKQSWQFQEQKLLTSIVKQSQENGNKWNQFARKLYQLSSQMYFRTGKQCRQRWLNHLDPNKKHGEWDPQQDKELAKMLIAEGKKWSYVSKKLGGSRTENMVKNRFRTLVSGQHKIYPQINNEFHLLKTFLDPQCAKKYVNKQQGQHQLKKEAEVIKVQQRSCEEIKRIEDEIKPESAINNEIGRLIRDDENSAKNIPQTSSAFELHQPFSPWYVITPNFSPYYVNVSTFSMCEASFLNNQFYCPKSNQKSEQS